MFQREKQHNDIIKKLIIYLLYLLQNLTSKHNMDHRVKMKNVLSELTEYHYLRQTRDGCGIGKLGVAALYSFCGSVFVCNEECFQLHIDSIPYGIPG